MSNVPYFIFSEFARLNNRIRVSRIRVSRFRSHAHAFQRSSDCMYAYTVKTRNNTFFYYYSIFHISQITLLGINNNVSTILLIHMSMIQRSNLITNSNRDILNRITNY